MNKIILIIIVLMVSTFSYGIENMTYSFFLSNNSEAIGQTDADFFIQTKDGTKFGYDFNTGKAIPAKSGFCFYQQEGPSDIINDDGTEEEDDNTAKTIQSCRLNDDILKVFVKTSSASEFLLLTSSAHLLKSDGGVNNLIIPALPNTLYQYEIKFDKNDVKKIDVAKIADDTSIANDINACIEQKYFIKTCPATNKKFDFPDECVIGSEKETKNQTPVKPIASQTASKGTAPANIVNERCSMNGICYANAIKDTIAEVRTNTDKKKRENSIKKLNKFIDSAIEKKELKSPCDKLLKVDLDILLKTL